MAGATEQHSNKISARKIAGYVFLPRILPRLQDLFASGFGYFAYLIAAVFQTVRILPATHPYTNAANIGKFGVRDAVFAAASSITISRKNIDQIIIFVTILAGIGILALQFVALLLSMVVDTAHASGVFGGLFETPNPQTDIAFLLLDHVFGVPDFFGSAINGTLPTPFHRALQALFQYYNFALLVIAALIFLYYILVVIVETATTGTPFGKRFAHIYAPLRLVFAIGLLVPINWGYNSSQYIVLFAAKMGSGLATNGWLTYNSGLENTFGVSGAALLAQPKTPEVDEWVAFMTLVHTCREAYCLQKSTSSSKYARCDRDDGSSDGLVKIKPYLINNGQAFDFAAGNTLDFRDASEFFRQGDIIVTFGELDTVKHSSLPGNVRPYCGKLRIPITSQDGQDPRGVNANIIQNMYYRMAQSLWVNPYLRALGERFARAQLGDPNGGDAARDCWKSELLGDAGDCSAIDGIRYAPHPIIKQVVVSLVQIEMNGFAEAAFFFMRGQMNMIVRPEILARGWGGAGIAYNDLAEVNGKFIEAVSTRPVATKFPMIMEHIAAAHARQDGQVLRTQRYDPDVAEGKPIPGLSGSGDLQIGQVMNDIYQYWAVDMTTDETRTTGNTFLDTINSLLGTRGLFCMVDPFPGPEGAYENFREGCPQGTHPIVQLIALGKGIVQNAIQNLGYALGFATLGGAASILEPHAGAALNAMSGFFLSITTIGLGIGFTLFYVIPFIPFIYFFFAVGGWVKAIFEAMVGAPLWALAHLRIDGDGFMGSSAKNGYLLIFEIFLRPILTVFGLVGSFAVFTAMAHILHEIFALVIVNVSGYEPLDATSTTTEVFRRNVIDEFFYTILYTIVIYMMATASFKMIDAVPNYITRWMGDQISSFGDQREDPTEGMVQYAAIGGHIVGGQIGSALTSGFRGVGQAAAPVVAEAFAEDAPTKEAETKTPSTDAPSDTRGGDSSGGSGGDSRRDDPSGGEAPSTDDGGSDRRGDRRDGRGGGSSGRDDDDETR